MTTFPRNTPVTLTPSGAHAVVVDTPDTVAAERGLHGHYRVRLANGTTRLVAEDKLRAVENARVAGFFRAPATEPISGKTYLWGSPDIAKKQIRLFMGSWGGHVSMCLTEAEAEALVAALQHALAELALAE